MIFNSSQTNSYMFEKISDLRDDGASGSAEDAVRTKVNWNGEKLEISKTHYYGFQFLGMGMSSLLIYLYVVFVSNVVFGAVGCRARSAHFCGRRLRVGTTLATSTFHRGSAHFCGRPVGGSGSVQLSQPRRHPPHTAI